jgi:hypothetical protein
VGSIPIARSTFRRLPCPCVALGGGSAYRPLPTVSMWLQPFPRSNASIGPSVEFGLDGPIRPSSTSRGPTYRENSHVNHTWIPQLHQTACFKGSEAPSP